MSQSKPSSSSSPKRSRSSPFIVPAYIPPAALTPRAMNPSIYTSPSRVQYIPIINLAAGPFADAQDPTLDADITSFNALPPSPPIASHPIIPARDLAWRAHLMHLQSWHALTLRITASELRASHCIVVRELAATHGEAMQQAKAARERDLPESQNWFAEIERVGRGRDGLISRLYGELGQLKGDLEFMHQLNVAQARVLGEKRGKVRMWTQAQRQALKQGTKVGAGPFALDDVNKQSNASGGTNATDTTFTPSTSTSPTVSIHHPNNAKRAKDIRHQQPTWSTLENLSLPAGGLPIRKARRELGLPTPRGTLETVRVIGECDWLPGGVARSMSMEVGRERGGLSSPPLTRGMRGGEARSGEMGMVEGDGENVNVGAGAYRRGNGMLTRSGRLIQPAGEGQGLTQMQMQMLTQGPRSARTLRDVEAEMMSRPLTYDGERMRVGFGFGGSGSGSRSRSRDSYTVPPNTAVEVEKGSEKRDDGERRDSKEGKDGEGEDDEEEGEEKNTPAETKQQPQENINRIAREDSRAVIEAGPARWGPGPSVLSEASQGNISGNGGARPRTS